MSAKPLAKVMHFGDRGFETYCKFKDAYGSEVKVVESSWAEADAVWIFCSNDTGHFDDPAPHLTVEQAKCVRDALDLFIKRHK